MIAEETKAESGEVERVAKAVTACLFEHDIDVELADEIARAAIAAMNEPDHANVAPVEAPEKVTPSLEFCARIRASSREDGGLRIWSDDLPGLILSHKNPSAVWRDLGPAIAGLISHKGIPSAAIAAMNEGRTEAEWRKQTGPWAHLTKEQTDELIASCVAAKAAENAELREALTAILSDILEYERINNLAPNLGRENCWDSVTRARALLSRSKAEGS